ncbi:MAG: zinc-ribbon domain-containing protein [Acidobacteria bacterium]|nr:zinc-ribbon domain-containing protein [Acidobacteriota bacterium]
MFCPKCGQQNPDNGKFCRSCGTDLGNVSAALTGVAPTPAVMLDRKGRPITWERAIARLFSGLGFLAVAIVLAFTIGRGWWFWFLLPAFGSIGRAIAGLVQLRQMNRGGMMMSPNISPTSFPASSGTALPPSQNNYVEPDISYRTGDLVPPSVTDNTTRKLEVDQEGQTMTLPQDR